MRKAPAFILSYELNSMNEPMRFSRVSRKAQRRKETALGFFAPLRACRRVKLGPRKAGWVASSDHEGGGASRGDVLSPSVSSRLEARAIAASCQDVGSQRNARSHHAVLRGKA